MSSATHTKVTAAIAKDKIGRVVSSDDISTEFWKMCGPVEVIWLIHLDKSDIKASSLVNKYDGHDKDPIRRYN